jgi:alpha 1,6-mannosyltransferase
MNSTGPAAWTDVVFEVLQEHNRNLNTSKDLSFMTEPRLYGDVLVLTIDGFGTGQPHSNSTNNGSIPEAALMKHLFRGSWRGN